MAVLMMVQHWNIQYWTNRH